jgi:RNA polymerase sigma factor (sigma-70 family)
MSQIRFLHSETVARTVHKVLRSRTKDIHLIDDICQNVLILCWKYQREQEILHPEGFAATLTRRMYHSWMRKRKLLEWQVGFEKSSCEDDPARQTDKREEYSVLISLVNALPPQFRETIRLHLEGWTHERIAQEKNLPVGTIKTWFRRAKAMLKKAGARYFLN